MPTVTTGLNFLVTRLGVIMRPQALNVSYGAANHIIAAARVTVPSTLPTAPVVSNAG